MQGDKNILQKVLKSCRIAQLHFNQVILVCAFKKPKVYHYPSDLINFQYFLTPSTLPEGHFICRKSFQGPHLMKIPPTYLNNKCHNKPGRILTKTLTKKAYFYFNDTLHNNKKQISKQFFHSRTIF